MTARQKACKKCGDAIVLAKAPNGGWMSLAPYPDPEGEYRVDVLGPSLVVLPDRAQSSRATKRYEKHRCVPAAKAVPRAGRPQQLALGVEA